MRYTTRLVLATLLMGLVVSMSTTPLHAYDAPARSAADPGTVERDVVRGSYDVSPGGTLDLDVDRGNVVVEVGRGGRVEFEVIRTVKRGSQDAEQEILRSHEVNHRRDGNDVVIETRMDEDGGRSWRWWGKSDVDRLEVQVRVRVPRRYNIEFNTGAGNVQIAALEGEVEGTTGAGNVEIGDVDGPVRIKTGAGNVEVRGATAALSVKTGAGNISLRDVRGFVNAKTGAGNITAYITRQPDAASDLSSGTGNVTVYVPDQIDLEVDASTGIGSASTDFPLPVDDGWMSKSFAGTIGAGGPELRLNAGMGNVALKKR